MKKNQYTDGIDAIHAPSCAVERAVGAIRQNGKTEGSVFMKHKLYRTAIAATLAVIVTLGGVFGFNIYKMETEPLPFVLTVNAEEIKKNTPILLDNEDYVDYGYTHNATHYFIILDIRCEGDNINTVTYTSERGNFYVYYPESDNPVVSGIEEYVPDNVFLPYNCEPSAPTYSMWVEKSYYSSVTLDYEKQHQGNFTIGIVGALDDDYFLTTADPFGNVNKTDLEAKRERLSEIYGNTLHCTVEFCDGTTKTADILIDAQISPYYKKTPKVFENTDLSDSQIEAMNKEYIYLTCSLA